MVGLRDEVVLSRSDQIHPTIGVWVDCALDDRDDRGENERINNDNNDRY